MNTITRTLTLLLLGPSLWAWSPLFHETQTRLARRMLPKAMNQFLAAHETSLLEGARGVASDQVPTVEEIEAQFQLILTLSEAHKPAPALVRELGILAKQIQLLTDPSATVGVTPFRATYEAYGDEHLKELVLSREPAWAVESTLDPRPRLLSMTETKFNRYRSLEPSVDPETGRRLGVWDRLSIPYGQLQLSFSTGVNATANVYILLWRAAGDLWVHPEGHSPDSRE